MENSQVASIFDEIADLLELEGGNEFRVRSYRGAARAVRDLSRRLEDMVERDAPLTGIPNIGKSTAGKIREILETGTCDRLEKLRRELPEGLTRVMRLPKLGPRKAMELHRRLGVDGLDDLERACREHRVRELPGFGPKTEKNILDGLGTLKSAAGRILFKDAADHVDSLERFLDGVRQVRRWEVAGSFRRCKETVGDLDVLVEARDRKAASDAIAEYGEISEVDSRGREKMSVHLGSGLQVDFRFFDRESFGAALTYFTGSKAHNIALRRRAQDRNWKLNEYGLFKNDRRLAGNTEKAVYNRLGLEWVEPELREDRGEVEAAESGELPDLIRLRHVRGDLQSHSDASDGRASVEEMAREAKDRGYQYFAITDHSKRVTMAKGLDDDRCRRHADRIREVDETLDGFWLMAGIEVDILKTGRLDLSEKVLRDLDWVVASVHYDRDLGKEKNTDRMLAAISSGVVHCIGHPLGRIIGQREPIPLNMDRIFQACREHGVRLEVNAQPDRLDLPDTFCKPAREAGVEFTLGTDAHKPSDLDFMRFAVNVARRGWLTRKHVLNTLTAKQLRKALRRS